MAARALQANIAKLTFIKLSSWFMLFMPVVVPFYSSYGLSTSEFMWLKSIFSYALVALEVPSGYVADVWGRKRTVVFGCFLLTIGLFIYALAAGFWYFALAEVILAFGTAFVSGSDSALLYDSLAAQGKEKDYLRIEGRLGASGNFAEATAAILGGMLALLSLNLPYFVQACIVAVSTIVAMTLVEPPIARRFSPDEHLANMKRTIRLSLLEKGSLRWLILLTGLVGAITLLMAWSAQVYFEYVDLPLAAYGVIWAALNLVVGIGSWYAHRISNSISQYRIILLLVAILSISYLGAGFSIGFLGIAFVFLAYIGRGVATPVLKDLINKNTQPEMRATVLSIRSLFIRSTFAPLAIFVGWMTDAYSVAQAFILVGAFFFLFSVVLASIMKRGGWIT